MVSAGQFIVELKYTPLFVHECVTVSDDQSRVLHNRI